MAKKISDLTAISGGTFSTTDLFEVSVDTGGSVYVSRKITGQEMLDSIGSSNIGNSDLTISTTGTRKLIMGGALSTDTFTLRNSADTTYFMNFQGDGYYTLSSAGNYLTNAFSHYTDGRMMMAKSSSNFIELNASTGQNRLYGLNNGWNIETGSKETRIDGTATALRFYQDIVQLTGTLQAGSGTNSFLIQNGTAPTANKVNHFWMYSSDATAGNACPTFRTEDGTVIQIYQETTGVSSATFTANTSGISDDTATWGGYTIGQVVQALQNLGILA